jgi:pantoate--beta-alanine ligase
MKLLRDVTSVRRTTGAWKRESRRIALVPTMGNLHDGHLSLMRLARRRADRVVASIFVNPTQFGPGEDYSSYPRTLASDRTALREAGVDALFLPTAATMYPGGGRPGTVVSVPGLSRDLCGAFRPVHFDGVASVVLRLLNIVAPEVAVFGEKDYQQLVILRRMVADLHLPVKIVAGATVREPDGLAMSSRNQYLDPELRRRAPALHGALLGCRERLAAGDRDFRAIELQALGRLRRSGFRPDYVAIRDAGSLEVPKPRRSRTLRVLAAAWLGRARLIDNVAARLP